MPHLALFMTNSQIHLNQYQLNNQIFSPTKLNLINELQILHEQTFWETLRWAINDTYTNASCLP